jgi:hypothetical protein
MTKCLAQFKLLKKFWDGFAVIVTAAKKLTAHNFMPLYLKNN